MKGKVNNGFSKPVPQPAVLGLRDDDRDDYAQLEKEQDEALEEENEEAELNPPEVQRRIWGGGPEKQPYFQADYDELDKIYWNLTSGLRRSGGMNPTQIYHFRNVAKWSLERDRCIAQGDVKSATAYVNMIDKTLAGESLRKKDEKPLENFRLDDIVLKFQRVGLMDDEGKIYDLETCQNVIADIMMRKKYSYSKDAADQMLGYIVNNIRSNEGLSELPYLPDELRFAETGEFADTPNEAEQTAYRELGLTRYPPRKPPEDAPKQQEGDA